LLKPQGGEKIGREVALGRAGHRVHMGQEKRIVTPEYVQDGGGGGRFKESRTGSVPVVVLRQGGGQEQVLHVGGISSKAKPGKKHRQGYLKAAGRTLDRIDAKGQFA